MDPVSPRSFKTISRRQNYRPPQNRRPLRPHRRDGRQRRPRQQGGDYEKLFFRRCR
jgi:hypothetical protein